MQGSLLSKLRNAYDAYDESTDFTPLIIDADMGRDGTVKALIELQQRLYVAAPILSGPTPPQHPRQPFMQPANAQFNAFPFLTPTATDQPVPVTVEPHQRADSVTEDTTTPPERHWNFNPFHRSKRQPNSRNGSQDKSPEVDQLGFFKRVQTLQPEAANAVEHSNTRSNSIPATTPDVPTQNNAVMSRNTSVSTRRGFQYGIVEDNATDILTGTADAWRRSTRTSTHMPSYTSPPPDSPFAPPMRTSTSRTSNSTNSSISFSTPHPTSKNNYLGFCKGAWKLQNGDQSAMRELKDWSQSARSPLSYLQCSECKFEGHINPDIIWDRVYFQSQDMKFRWSFLAKSHVKQSKMMNRDEAKRSNFTYQCMFCVFQGCPVEAMQGVEAYKNHILVYHSGRMMTDVVLDRVGCVNDCVCDDRQTFDINLHPRG